jgi:hypothetical protein
MLKFDSRGNLTPYEKIPSTTNEMRNFFVESIQSRTRKVIFEKYVNYSDALKSLLEGAHLQQWINGSFVTKKINPSDIDLVTFISHKDIIARGDKLKPFGKAGSFAAYGIDAYLLEVFPKSNKEYFRTEYDTKEWFSWFTKTKINRRGNKFPKGFLEIIY